MILHILIGYLIVGLLFSVFGYDSRDRRIIKCWMAIPFITLWPIPVGYFFIHTATRLTWKGKVIWRRKR